MDTAALHNTSSNQQGKIEILLGKSLISRGSIYQSTKNRPGINLLSGIQSNYPKSKTGIGCSICEREAKRIARKPRI